MIKRILRLNGARFYEVYRYMEVKNPNTGAKGKDYAYFTQVFAAIQPTGTQRDVKGLMLQSTEDAGDKKLSDYIMYSAEERIEKERILYKGIFYSIRSVEYYDNGIMKYYKSYLVKVDNQNVK